MRSLVRTLRIERKGRGIKIISQDGRTIPADAVTIKISGGGLVQVKITSRTGGETLCSFDLFFANMASSKTGG